MSVNRRALAMLKSPMLKWFSNRLPFLCFLSLGAIAEVRGQESQSDEARIRGATLPLPVEGASAVVGFGSENLQGNTVTTGSIQGTIKYVADPQHPWRLGRYYIRDTKSGELAEAVVAISKRGLKATEEKREPVTAIVDQKDFQFTPETTAIRVGDHVRFLNSDDHAHNVKTSHPDFSFNVTMPVGSEHTETFKVAGGARQPYRIDCVFHTAMQSWIFVFDHPWFQVTNADGSFHMKDVPAGEYRLDVVHPAGDLRHRQTIQVVAGEGAKIEIRMQPKKANP